MKLQIKKSLIAILCLVLCISGLFSCKSTSGTKPVVPPESAFCNINPMAYQKVAKQKDMQKFYNETFDVLPEYSVSHDGVLDYGFVDCVYYTLKVNDNDVPVYSTRCGKGIHTFGWIDVDTNVDLKLNIELDINKISKKTCVVLPEKTQVKATINDGIVKAVINQYGNYSFVFDESAEMALTLFVAKKEKFVLPNGYTEQVFEPGKYTKEQTTFTTTNQVYRFKSGNYDISSISLPSDSILYFEPGVYIKAYQENGADDYRAVIDSSNTQNVKVLGRGLIDYSKCIGGEVKTKGAVLFMHVKNVEFSGVVSINSHTWTLCFFDCSDVKVTKCMNFGYRTFSDGIMFSDCKRSNASDCFVRTGDDGIEVKAFTSSTSSDCFTDDVVIQNNSVWTDKGVAYGCIYEAMHNVKNVKFLNNSVGFAQADWSERLGCCAIQMGSNKDAVWEDVHFENIDVYKTNCSLITVYNRAVNADEGGLIKDIYFKNIVAKYAKQTSIPVFAINIAIVLQNGAVAKNSRIGSLYLDNVDYKGIKITPSNYEQYLCCNIDADAIFTKKSIKINTINS